MSLTYLLQMLDRIEPNESQEPLQRKVQLADQQSSGLTVEEMSLLRGDYSVWEHPSYRMREDDIDYIRDFMIALSSQLVLRTIVMPHNCEHLANTLRDISWERTDEYPIQADGQVCALSICQEKSTFDIFPSV